MGTRVMGSSVSPPMVLMPGLAVCGWMGGDWASTCSFRSREICRELLKNDPEYKGPRDPNSPWRDRPIEESLKVRRRRHHGWAAWLGLVGDEEEEEGLTRGCVWAGLLSAVR